MAFQAPVRIRVDEARVISCYGTHFQSLTTIDVGRGEIRLSEAEFAHPSIVSGRIYEGKPRVASLHRANVANLTLADVDLRGCSFVDVHNLDGLRFEGASEFPTMGGRWRTHRRVIADELDLRESGARDEVVVARIARAYRALRKGREDSKDAPGAADFYYGEMEMRRISSNPFERTIITLYWLLSGYGLRASRALAALGVAVLAFAFAFDAWGFYPDGPFGKSAIFSAESTSSLFRTPDPPGGSHLTDAGHVLQMGLRLVGPLFLGLALLALRGRVKR